MVDREAVHQAVVAMAAETLYISEHVMVGM